MHGRPRVDDQETEVRILLFSVVPLGLSFVQPSQFDWKCLPRTFLYDLSYEYLRDSGNNLGNGL